MKILGSKKNLGLKKILGPEKIFGLKKMLGPEKILGLKNCWIRKNVGSSLTILGKKKLLVNTAYVAQSDFYNALLL